MFVFPAFDSNYKTRKRTFRCCQNCRLKRVKCDITSTDYESTGCRNCVKHNWTCDFRRSDKIPGNETSVPSLTTTASSSSRTLFYTPERITKQYLKDKFNFISATPTFRGLFTYLSHSHPKVVMSSSENRFHHESGVYIQDENKDIKSDFDEYYIKNINVYNFLVSIDAFTLGSREFPISNENLTKLLKLYFYKINSIFPLIHEQYFWKDFQENNVPNLIIYAMVLVILRDKLAEPIIKDIFFINFGDLTQDQFDEKRRNYMTDLEYKIRQLILVLPQLGIDHKLCRMVISLLLSLHFNFDSSGSETSSHDLTDAINLAVAIGIHMKLFGEMNPDIADYTTKLWWCCYIFDRFNGFNNSRCLFIRADDFNVDLPYNSINLLKLVQLARSIENMVSAVYRPFNTNNLIVTRNRYKMFNIEDFEKMEFDVCDRERSSSNNPYDFVVDLHLANIDEYISNTIHFLTRIVNNVVIILGQKAKYDDPNIPDSIPEAAATNAALNIIWYFNRMKDELLLNVYLLPWTISVPMALALKQKARLCLKSNEEEITISPDFTWEEAFVSVERFSSTWWIVDEICKQVREFVNKLEENQTGLKRLWSQTDLRQFKKFRKDPTNALELNSILQPSEFDSSKPSTNLSSTNLSFMPINMDISDIQFDKYFESMQIDIFNNDFFKDALT